MPIYQIICPECGKQEIYTKETNGLASAPCPVCGKKSPRDWSATVADMPFRSYWTDALSADDKPVHITSRAQEKQLCKQFECERVN